MLNTINSLDQTMSSFEIAQITAVKIHAEISVQGKESRAFRLSSNTS